jgi:hypothetical protein
MPIYIANANGDWWEYRSNEVLHILNTDDLPPEEHEDWKTYGDMNATWICEYGTNIKHDFIPTDPPKVWYTDEELDAEVDEVIEAEYNEAYFEAREEIAIELDINEDDITGNAAVDEIIGSYIEENITFAEMVDKVYQTIKKETF